MLGTSASKCPSVQALPQVGISVSASAEDPLRLDAQPTEGTRALESLWVNGAPTSLRLERTRLFLALTGPGGLAYPWNRGRWMPWHANRPLGASDRANEVGRGSPRRRWPDQWSHDSIIPNGHRPADQTPLLMVLSMLPVAALGRY
jgi:hypothetical protein